MIIWYYIDTYSVSNDILSCESFWRLQHLGPWPSPSVFQFPWLHSQEPAVGLANSRTIENQIHEKAPKIVLGSSQDACIVRDSWYSCLARISKPLHLLTYVEPRCILFYLTCAATRRHICTFLQKPLRSCVYRVLPHSSVMISGHLKFSKPWHHFCGSRKVLWWAILLLYYIPSWFRSGLILIIIIHCHWLPSIVIHSHPTSSIIHYCGQNCYQIISQRNRTINLSHPESPPQNISKHSCPTVVSFTPIHVRGDLHGTSTGTS